MRGSKRAGARLSLAVAFAALGLLLLPGAGASAADGPGRIDTASIGLDFGTTELGTTSPAQTITLTNPGSTDAAFPVVVEGPFAVSATTCGATLAPGAACTMSFTFTPTALGDATGSLQRPPGSSSTLVGLRGSGVAAAAFPLSVTAGFLDFGTVPVFTTSQPTLAVVTNRSAAPVSFTLAHAGPTPAPGFAAGQFGAIDGCGPYPKVLAVGASCSVAYRYRPSSLGTALDRDELELTVTGDSQAHPFPVTLAGHTGSPLAFNGTRMAAGDIAVGSVGPALPFTITNTSDQPVGFYGYLQPYLQRSVAVDGCTDVPKVLAPGESCTITFRSTPLEPGDVTDSTGYQVTIVGLDANIGASVMISFTGTPAGTPPRPRLLLAPSSLAFGAVPVGGNSRPQSVTVTNPTASAIDFTAATTSTPSFDDNLGAFTRTTTCTGTPFHLEAGASCRFDVTFHPIVFRQDRLSTQGIEVALTSTPAGSTTPASTSFSASGESVLGLRAELQTLDFGAVPIGTTRSLSVRRITNTTSFPISFSTVTFPDFTIEAPFTFTDHCGPTLAPGATCSADVTFTPTAVGPREDSVSLTHPMTGLSGALATSLVVRGSGTGTAPRLLASPYQLQFFDVVPTGTSTDPTPVTITNQGTATMTGLSLVFDDPTAAYALDNGCPSELAPGASCTATITFHPTDTEQHFAVLRITSDGGSATTAMYGRGLAPSTTTTSTTTSTSTTSTLPPGTVVVVPTLPGLERREASRADDGEWILVLRYRDMETAERGPAADTSELSGRFIAMIDMASMSAARSQIVSE